MNRQLLRRLPSELLQNLFSYVIFNLIDIDPRHLIPRRLLPHRADTEPDSITDDGRRSSLTPKKGGYITSRTFDPSIKEKILQYLS